MSRDNAKLPCSSALKLNAVTDSNELYDKCSHMAKLT